MPTTTIDHAPVRVSGAVSARRARVIWHDHRLHVFRSSTDVTSLDAPEPPVRRSGQRWECAGAQWYKAGCACGCSVCRTPRATLLETAAQEDEVLA